MTLKEKLNWRYATKSYGSRKVEQEKIDAILEAIRLAPSSSGLQPFKVLVITDQAVKEQLRAVAYDQQQITQASHVLVFAAWDAFTPERINAVFEHNNRVRNLPASATDDYRTSLLESFASLSADQHYFSAAKQGYIALGFALLAAAELGVDATPMEGFDNQGVDALLKLSEQGLKSAVILALGYRDADTDWLVNLAKVRREHSELFIEIH